MTIDVDMTQNRVPYGLLTDEEKAALHEHEKAGGEFAIKFYSGKVEPRSVKEFQSHCVYRTVPLPLTQDEIAWDRLPDWAEWVARDSSGNIWCLRYEPNVLIQSWSGCGRRIDEFPGIVKRGTCDWTASKQRRPQK